MSAGVSSDPAASGSSSSVPSASTASFVSIRNPFLPALTFRAPTRDLRTVADLKQYLCTHYESHPPVVSQRLICEGRLLANEEVLAEVLSAASTRTSGGDEPTIHLAVRDEYRTTPVITHAKPTADAQEMPAAAAAATVSASAAASKEPSSSRSAPMTMPAAVDIRQAYSSAESAHSPTPHDAYAHAYYSQYAYPSYAYP